MDLVPHVGHAIRIAREAKRWNQAELGLRAGHFADPLSGEPAKPISASWVSEAERNPYRTSYAILARLAAALGTTIGALERSIHLEPLAEDEKHAREDARARAPG